MNNFKFLSMRVNKLGIKKMTQDELSKLLNIERNRIQALEQSPKVIPKYEELKAYCDYFHTTSDYLLGINEAKPQDENINMISRATGLSDDSIIKLKQYNSLQRKITDKLISSGGIDCIINAYVFRNSYPFHKVEIIDEFIGNYPLNKDEVIGYHNYQSEQYLLQALELLNVDKELFNALNSEHSYNMWKTVIDFEIDHIGIDATLKSINGEDNIPKEILQYIKSKKGCDK